MRLSRRDPGPHGGVSLGRSHPHPGPSCLSPNLHSLVTAIPVKRCREVPPAASRHWLGGDQGLRATALELGVSPPSPPWKEAQGTDVRAGEAAAGVCWGCGQTPTEVHFGRRDSRTPCAPLVPVLQTDSINGIRAHQMVSSQWPPPPKGTICLMVSLVMGVRARVMEEKA